MAVKISSGNVTVLCLQEGAMLHSLVLNIFGRAIKSIGAVRHPCASRSSAC